MDIDLFVSALGDIPRITDPVLVRQKSRDMTGAFSPVMKKELADKTADLVVQPRTKAEIVRIAAAAAKSRMPLIARGGGTANFGQGIPLKGGAIVDMTAYDALLWHKPGAMRAQSGIRMIDIDAATRPAGWELRIHPSTKRAATLGGFVGGGHAGIGSAVYGIMRDRGNILALEVISVEEEPKSIELRGADVNLVHHAYGSNGLIAEIELPLAPAWPWREAIVLFDRFMDSARFSIELASADGMIKKVISMLGWPIPGMMRPLDGIAKDGKHAVVCLIAEQSAEAFRELAADHRGEIAVMCAEGEGPYGCPAYELVWGHCRLHVNKTDRSINNAVGLFPPGDLLGSIERVHNRFAADGPLHLEVKRFDGALSVQGSPFFKFRDEAQLAEIARGMAAEGCSMANNQTFLVKEGGMKPVGTRDIDFKRLMDPHDLMNPGKLTLDDADRRASAGAALPTAGWTFKRAV